jgi:hypothetical protein
MFFHFPKFTPEALLMLPLAVGLDLASILFFLIGADDFGILDFIGICTIGVWLFFKKGEAKRKGGFFRRIFTGRTRRFLVPIFGEIIPYLGVLPFWTLSVWYNLD